jgi:DNA processing protein
VGLPFVAVVGSRNATYYGLKASERVGWGLGQSGVGVVSGLARGIDAAAHWGCLRGGGHTVGVLGTGIDVVYPRENERLFQTVCSRGTIVTEFPPGTPPEPRNFPIRNRIISGMSKGVVVVEATKRSGSLITAGMALDQGREVFAVPGSIDSFKSTGTHSLLKQGARLVENSDDVLEELSMRPRSSPAHGPDRKEAVAWRDMDEIEQRVFDILGMYPIHIDEIVRISKLDAGKILGVLLRLELEGMVNQLPGMMFVRGRDS